MNTLSSLLNFIGKYMGVVTVSATSVSSLPTTITDSDILAKHKCVKATLSNPAAQKGEWTVTPSAGSLTISGSISGTTDIELDLAVKTN